jgi:PAS domain S-box-containing protein
MSDSFSPQGTSPSLESASPPDALPGAEALRLAKLLRLAGVLADLPDAVLCLDRTWHITYANTEAIRLSRFQPELFATLDFWEAYPHLIGSEMERRYRAAMASGQSDHFEFHYEPFDMWVDIFLMSTEDGIAACYRDISERKHAEQREADAAKQVREAFEAIPDGVVMIDSRWRFTFANQRALETVGRTDIVGHDIFELFPGNRQEPFNSAYRKTMATREATEFEAFNGAPLNLWVRVQAKPYTQDSDDGIIVFFSDISDRKYAELREQETARRLAQVLDATSDAVASLDREWRYTYLNANARKLIDPQGKLLGTRLLEAFPSVVDGPSWQIYQRTMNEGIPGQVEYLSPAPLNGWLSITSQPTPDGIVLFFRDVTEERNHDAIVRGQQELLAAVQSAARLATWEFNPQSGEMLYGPGSFDVLGRALDQLTNFEHFRPILVAGHFERIEAEIARSTRAGGPMLVEFAVKTPSGETVWIESRGEAYRVADGSSRIRGMFLDITERYLGQQDLVASEARYRVLADLNPQAIWMGDAQGNITYANQGFLAYLGLTLDDLGASGWLQAFAPSERKRVAEVWRGCVATGEDYDLEALLCHAETGEFRYWHLRAAPVRDASGAILHWLGVGQDVHEIKTYTAALRAEQMETERRRAELETIYATTPIGLALLDPVNLTFLNLNDQEAQMLGAAREQLLGRPLAEIAPPEKIPHVYELMRMAASGTPVRNQMLEGELTPTPGERRYWNVNYSPIFNEDGTVRAISTASIEITHQKRAEAALVQSEKLAAVGRLASSISHEINNPLEAITNLLYLISLDEQLPPELSVYVNMAQSELSRVSQIATQTLRFHRQAVAPTAVTAAELVDAVVRLYTGRLANSSIAIDARYLTQTPIVCFENDIRQVLNNLIANAIDAMRTGGRLMIRAHETRHCTPPGVRITIADTGHGMNQATIHRIFEPFFTTKDLNGTGLGLWISAGIVERHRGSLHVRSSDRPGRSGTVFTLFLPYNEQPKAT